MKKILTLLAAILCSTSVFAYTLDVTPEFLATHQSIPLNWKVGYQNYNFDIENNTNHNLLVSIWVNLPAKDYPANEALVISGACGVQTAALHRNIHCSLKPGEHYELDYNVFPKPKINPIDLIEGTLTLTQGE